jgi:hypothetical protein
LFSAYENGPDADARTNSDLAGGGFIETLLDKKLAGRFPDALKFSSLFFSRCPGDWGSEVPWRAFASSPMPTSALMP